MKLLFIVCLILCSLLFFMDNRSEAQNYVWAKGMGTTQNDFRSVIITDASENVFLAGTFNGGPMDFDPSVGSLILSPTPSYLDAIFFAKYDVSGNLVWVKIINSHTIETKSIAMDSNKNIYLAGYFGYCPIGTLNDTADFDPGPGVANLIAHSNQDIFLAKYDSSGNFIWARNFGGTNSLLGFNGADRLSIHLDPLDNIIIAGDMCNQIDFNPSPILDTISPIGTWNIFFSKYSSAGNYLWTKTITTTDAANNVVFALDSLGNIFLSGEYYGTTDFDPSPAIANLTAVGTRDVFFAKYDSLGNYLWAKSIGGVGYTRVSYIDIDSSNNIYLTGQIDTTEDFDPSASIATLTPLGFMDSYISKYDCLGNYLWAFRIGGNNTNDVVETIAVKINHSDLFICGGMIADSVDFDPSIAVSNLYSGLPSWCSFFWAKYDIAGNLIWAKNSSGGYNGCGGPSDLHISTLGNMFMSGTYEDSTDFDPSPSAAILTTVSPDHDIFFAKYHGAKDSVISGITNPRSLIEISLSPNPNHGQFLVQIKNLPSNNIIIEVMNTLGETIYSKRYVNRENLFYNEIILPSNSEGIYFLRVGFGEKSICRKLVLIQN